MKTISLFLILIFFSCQEKIEISTDDNKKDHLPFVEIAKISQKELTIYKNSDTVKIDYSEHKNLLDILSILPDNALQSWGWTVNERKDFVEFIKTNHFAHTSTKNFTKFELSAPNTIKIQVVDGSWILSIYKIKPNNYIVITDDIVGDGNNLHAFEYNNWKLKPINFQDLFDAFLPDLLIKKNDNVCRDLLEDNKIGFEYDFIGTSKIEICNAYYLKKVENKNCLKGNTLDFTFNPETKKFELQKIIWKEATDN